VKSQGGNYKNSLNIRLRANLLDAVATRAGEQAYVFIINDTSGRANALAAGRERLNSD